MFNPSLYLETVSHNVIGNDPHIERQVIQTLINKRVLNNLHHSVFVKPMASLEAVYADLVKSLVAPNEDGKNLPTNIPSFIEATPAQHVLMTLLASANGTNPSAVPGGPLQNVEPLPQSPNAKPIPKEDLEPYCKVRATAAIQPIASPFLPLPYLASAVPVSSGACQSVGNVLTMGSSASCSPLLVPDMTMFPYPPPLPMYPLQQQMLLPSPLFPTPDPMSLFLATGIPPALLQMHAPVLAPVPEPVQDPSPPRAKRRKMERTKVPVGSEIPMPVGSPLPKILSNPAPSALAPSTLAPATLAPSTLAPSTLAPSTLAPSTLLPASAAPVVRSQGSSGSPLEMLERMIPRNIVPPSSVSEPGHSPHLLIFEELMRQIREGTLPEITRQ